MNIQTSKGMGLKSSSGMGIKTTKGAALKEGKDIYKSDDYAQMRKYLGTKSHYEGGYNPTPRSRVIKVKAAQVKPESATPSPEVEVPRIKTPHGSAVGTVKRMLFLFEQNAHSHSPPLGWDAFS
ncbi:uncharacterized protein [Haliotis cracherodii]|uniref:uncharacterized protein n=1 Tax=Haliotis cracherodii TaxID=6455 RepID=UPI0039EAEC02